MESGLGQVPDPFLELSEELGISQHEGGYRLLISWQEAENRVGTALCVATNTLLM